MQYYAPNCKYTMQRALVPARRLWRASTSIETLYMMIPFHSIVVGLVWRGCRFREGEHQGEGHHGGECGGAAGQQEQL